MVVLAVDLAALVASLSSTGPETWKALLLPALWVVPGALVAAGRPRSPVGWLILAVATMFCLSGAATTWVRTGQEPYAALAVWYVDRGSAFLVPCTLLFLLLLPDGQLPGRGWRWPVALVVTAMSALVTVWCLVAGPAAGPGSAWPAAVEALDNPLGVLPPAWGEVAGSLDWALQLPLLLGLVAGVVRLRRARDGERSRLVTMVLALGIFVVAVVAGHLLWAPFAAVIDVLASALLGGVLVTAVLRRHLDGVTVVVHHASVGAVLAVMVAAAYATSVALLTAAAPAVSTTGAGVVAGVAALAVLPLRERLRLLVSRLLYGDRHDPFRAVVRLAEHAHGAPSVDDVLAAVADSVAGSLRVPWVHVEVDGRSVERGSREPGSAMVSVVLRSGETVRGVLEVTGGRGRRLRRDEWRLLEVLGGHAGVAIDAVLLAERTAEHTRALHAAREEERRLLGRELHDGLGPTFAGVAMQLGALRPLVHRQPDLVARRLADLEGTATQALTDLRRLAHQVRPAVLDHVGLRSALRHLGELLDLEVEVIGSGVEVLPAAVELAAYRIGAEALTNVARHAGTGQVRLHVDVVGRDLSLVVEDRGIGLARDMRPGLGLGSMRERCEELGGRLTVETGQEGGVVVKAVLPLGADDELAPA